MFKTGSKILTLIGAALIFTAGAAADTLYINGSDHVAKGAAALKAGNLDRAIRLTKPATKRGQPDARRALAHNNLCIAYYLKREYGAAIEHCTEALEARPTFWRAYNNRGNAYLETGKVNLAIADYEDAKRLNPKLDIIDTNLQIAQAQRAYLEARVSRP